MSERIKFLQSFLGALGALAVHVSSETADTVRGTVIYDPFDPEERQEFCWHASEVDVPAQDVVNLVTLLHTQNLLDIDRISIWFDDLRMRYNRLFQPALNTEQFSDTLRRLGAIRVDMVDDGEEGDAFFIHD